MRYLIIILIVLFTSCKKDNSIFPDDEEKVPLITDGLVGYWPLDSNALDYSGNELDGIIINTEFTSDHNNKRKLAAIFQSTSINERQTIKIQDHSLLDLSNTFSISSWVYIDQKLGNSSVQDYEFFSKWGSSGVGHASYVLGVNGDHNFYLGTYNNKNTTVYSDITVPTEEWINLTSTFDNGNGKLYMNGELIGELDNMDIPQNSSTSLNFGARADNLSTFNGKLDEIYLFDRVLTDQEIKNLAK